MKTKSKLAVCIVALFALTSCILFPDEPDGKQGDTIKLSQKEAVFGADGGSLLITTGGSTWWITSVSVNGKHFFDKNFRSQEKEVFYRFKEDCFTVERRTKNTLFIQLDENTTSEQREVFVQLQDRNYFGGVKIIQKPKKTE